MTPIYLRYNSGLAVCENGQRLADLLKQWLSQLPADKTPRVLCHSMGGLVMRSALHMAEQAGDDWPARLGEVIFLGTPHQGAVLEKTGSLIDYLLSINPYSAPFAKLGQVRSQGIRNLRLGSITADHQTIQLPQHVDAFALAGNTRMNDQHGWIGDGLVSLNSALGKHRNPALAIDFKASNTHIFDQVSHMGLLSDQQVYATIKRIFSQ
jgi:triacylglycerol esterase/lipase EstA (alpha/beta hydrolase family)